MDGNPKSQKLYNLLDQPSPQPWAPQLRKGFDTSVSIPKDAIKVFPMECSAIDIPALIKHLEDHGGVVAVIPEGYL